MEEEAGMPIMTGKCVQPHQHSEECKRRLQKISISSKPAPPREGGWRGFILRYSHKVFHTRRGKAKLLWKAPQSRLMRLKEHAFHPPASLLLGLLTRECLKTCIKERSGASLRLTGNQKQQTATENTTATQPHSGKLYNRVRLMNVHTGKPETNRLWVPSYKARRWVQLDNVFFGKYVHMV